MPIRFSLGLLLAFAGTAAAAAAAPLPFDAIQRGLASVHQFQRVEIAPDGAHLAYAITVNEHTSLVTLSLSKGDHAPIAASKRTITGCPGTTCDNGDFNWSPDGRRIAFVTTGASGQGQLAIYDVARGTTRVITRAKGPLGTPRWSHDGTRIAFLYSPGAPKTPSPLNPETEDAGVVGSTTYEQRLAVVPAAGGPIRLLGPGDLNVYEYDWSPDDTRFVASAAHGNGDANWWIAELYTIDARSGAAARIHHPALQMAQPRWSPDGKQIAYIGGIMSDEAITGGDVYVVPAAGGDAVDVTPGLAASVQTIAWSAPSRILATELAGGNTVVAAIDPGAKTQSQLWSGQQLVTASIFAGFTPGDLGVSVVRDGTSAVIRQSITAPPEIAVGPIGAWRTVTNENARTPRLTGPARSITWKNGDFNVQGWLVMPAGYQPSSTYPLVTVVHGGPAYANLPMFPSGFDAFDAMLAARGYVVYEPNPRGSYGQGEKFTQANVKDFGYGDLSDILAGLDAAGSAVHVDPKRVGIFGWSYGGYMTMWAVTQTDRFKAAVAGAGLSDWLSYYGTNDIDTWMIPYFGASVYDAPDVYAKSSPINFIKKVHTPVLMVHGNRDAEVPVTQSYEYWHALKDLGVPTQLVIYPGEGHEFYKPRDQRDVSMRIAGWFDRWLR